jgi:hypothetical protein
MPEVLICNSTGVLHSGRAVRGRVVLSMCSGTNQASAKGNPQ